MFRIIFRRLSVYSTVAYYYIRRQVKQHRWLRKRWAFNEKAGPSFENFIQDVPAGKVFVHVALSPMRRFTEEKNTYAYLMDVLRSNFDVIASQAFTPQVRKTKVFDPAGELPAYGAFAKMFFRDSQFRNHDPCYSVMAAGETGFNAKDLSFQPNGLFRQMVDQGYHCVNIGLDHVTSSLMHFVEYEQRVPYLRFFDETYHIQTGNSLKTITYPLHANRSAYSVKGYIWWNKHRLMKDLDNTGIVQQRILHGVCLYSFGMQQLYRFVTEKVKADPYYLIKW